MTRTVWQAGGRGACGSMYLDGGEELLPGSSLDNYVSFEALQVLALTRCLASAS